MHLEPLHIDVLKLGVPIRMLTTSLEIFLVGFQGIAFLDEDSSNRCLSNLKPTLPHCLGNMSQRMRRPFDNGALIRFWIGLQFNGLENLRLMVFGLFSPASLFSDSLKKRFFF